MEEVKDILTGLDRYEEFLKKLEKEIQELDDCRIAIIYTDIKYFKYINDTYGYQRGDMLLKEFTRQVTQGNASMLCAARVFSDNIVLASKVRTAFLMRKSVKRFTDTIWRWKSVSGRIILPQD